ncbi:MAG: hypothetical protein AAF481_19125 [Acidobacteriota bacterium]
MRPTLLACTLFALACQSSPAEDLPAVSPGESFRLAVGESARLDLLGWRVTFVEVVGDSRCPKGVQCVWAGEATVRLEIEHDGETSRHEVSSLKERADVNGRTCHLRQVDPYPESSERIPPEDYSIELEFAAE